MITIDVNALCEFVRQQCTIIELSTVPSAILEMDGVTEESAQAIWVAAGVATQIGLKIMDEPEKFLVEKPAPSVDLDMFAPSGPAA